MITAFDKPKIINPALTLPGTLSAALIHSIFNSCISFLSFISPFIS